MTFFLNAVITFPITTSQPEYLILSHTIKMIIVCRTVNGTVIVSLSLVRSSLC